MADTIELTGVVSTESIVLNGTGSIQQITATGTVAQRGPTGLTGPQGERGLPGDDAPDDHTLLTNIGVNTHAQIDTALSTSASHIANTSNPHNVTKAQVGLSNVDNTSDNDKPISSAAQTALDAKAAGVASSTDNAVTRFDGTGGKTLQNSVVTVSDAGLVETPNNFRSNHTSGNPTYQFAESGTNRAQIFYDVTNNRLTLQNQENNNADATYISDPLTVNGQITGDRILGTLVDVFNSGSTFPEVRFLEGTTVRGKIFYDFDEDQIVIQNQESDADDAVRINESVLINGVEKKLTISQTVGGDTSQYRLWQDESDLFVIDRIGDTTGDGDHWVLVDLRSPQMQTLEDSESTLSLTTRAGAPGGVARTLDVYNDEYSRDNGMGMRQLYKNTTPNPIRFEEHDKTTNNGAWTMTDVALTNGSPNGSYASVTGVTPSAEDWIWDNAGVYLPDDTKIVSIDTGAKTFVMNRDATSTGTAASVRGKNIRENIRISNRQLLVRKFIADDADNVAEFGGTVAGVTPTDAAHFATKGYVDDEVSGIDLSGKEDVSNKSTSTSLGTSDTLYPTQNAVKTYVDGKTPGAWQTWVPTQVGFSAAPTGGIYRYRTVNDEVEIEIRQPNDGTSNATNFTITLPVTAATVTDMVWQATCRVRNNGTFVNAPGYASIASAGTVVEIFINTGTTAWGTAGGKRVDYLRMRYKV